MLIKNVIRPTLIARNVMRLHGKSIDLIWTNTYKHCRTVKCYGGNAQLDLDLRNMLSAAGVGGFSIKRTGRGTIVRIPRTEQP